MPANPPVGDGDGDPGGDPDAGLGLDLDRSERIGASLEGRPIRAWRFGRDGAAPPLLIVAGVHGDEPSSVAAAAELGRRLAAGIVASPQPTWLVPRLNPDGLARGQKNSARDVDLNRNFPSTNFSREHRPGYFPGQHPLSEPETAALAALIQREAIAAVVAVHAPFACVNYDGPAAGWAARVAGASGWPARADIGYPTPGSLGTWLGVDRGLPVLTLELPPGPLDGFREACRVALDQSLLVTL